LNLDGKIAIVTGGSKGIGLGIAKTFAENGATVIVTGRNKNDLDKVSSNSPKFLGIVSDVRDSDQVNDLIDTIIEKFGRIDVLVNNAGILPRIKKLHEIDEKEWDDVIDTNLTGPFRITKAVIPHLQKNGGSVINISSDAGLKAYSGFNADAYSATKAALILLTKSWALQYAKDKIRVNCICPGVVDTDMTKPFYKTEKDKEFINAEHPIGRMGTPEDIAKAALYFATDDSSWTTGAILAVDGGESLK
jgi:NAD(P)-dependent dehydrogenase (short-subunit alcohol dehydrogenase family)